MKSSNCSRHLSRVRIRVRIGVRVRVRVRVEVIELQQAPG